MPLAKSADVEDYEIVDNFEMHGYVGFSQTPEEVINL